MSRRQTLDFLALLDELDQLGVTVTTDDEMHLVIDGPSGAITDRLAAAMRRHRHLLLWTVIARGTGHVWCPCTTCGQPVLLDPHPRRGGDTVWPTCRLTPGCAGRHVEPGKAADR